MPTFNYKAKDNAGNTVTGTVEADTPSQAAGKIREMGHLPMDIKPAGFVAAGQSGEAGSVFARYIVYPIWTGVSLRSLMFFYRQMSTLLASGMSLSESLRSVRRRMGGKLGAIIDEMVLTTGQGNPLSGVLDRHPKIFSRLQVALVRVGESGGLLEQMIDRIASYIEYEIQLRQRMMKALFYPILVVVFFLLWTVLMAYIQGGAAAGIAASIGLLCLSLKLVVLVMLVKLVFQFRPPRLVWDTIKIAPPWLGTAARKIAMSRFSRAFAVLYRSGVPMTESVSVAADACGNLALGGRIRQAIPAIQHGDGLTAALVRTGGLMPMVVDMLETGEKTGGMDSVLDKVSDYMDGEVDATMHKLAVLLFILPIIILGIVVAIAAVSFYGGYFNKLTGGGG